MTKFTNKSFSVGGSSDAYRDNWDRVFGASQDDRSEKPLNSGDESTAPVPPPFTEKDRRFGERYGADPADVLSQKPPPPFLGPPGDAPTMPMEINGVVFDVPVRRQQRGLAVPITPAESTVLRTALAWLTEKERLRKATTTEARDYYNDHQLVAARDAFWTAVEKMAEEMNRS